MKEFIITEKEAGARLSGYLSKILKEAGSGLIFKSLRKKNITLNDKKAEGKEVLKPGDNVKIWFSDETFNKFAGDSNTEKDLKAKFSWNGPEPEIIYEDNDVLILNKPVGVLSQKATAEDITLTEWVCNYVGVKEGFTPGVCNRLDRNTSGIVLAGKSHNGLAVLSKLLKDRTIHKYYITVVKGRLDKNETIEGYLLKKEQHNTVEIYKENVAGSSYIRTEYLPIKVSDDYTLLKVNLITGKSHQIRAHLASIGHPVIGDGKYGDRKVNEFFRRFNLNSQLLHAYEIIFPDMTDELSALSGCHFKAELPSAFAKIVKKFFDEDL